MLWVTGCASDKSTIQKASLANDQLAPAVMQDAELAAYFQSIGNRVIASAKIYDTAEGTEVAGLMGNNEAWCQSVRRATDEA